MKKTLSNFLLFFVFGFIISTIFLSCEDNRVEEPMSMKLWLNGEEVDVASEYQRISAFAEQSEYTGFDSTVTFLKKILVIHFQKDAGRLELSKEHYAVVFTDWEGDTSNGLPIDEGSYQWPSVCPVCPRACMHGAPSKWVRMEILGDEDAAISGTAHIESISESGNTWTISGEGEGTFYNPYIEANMSGKIEFTNLKINSDSEESPYHNYGGR